MLDLSDREFKILHNWYIKDYLRKDGEYLLHEKLEKYQQIDEDCKKPSGRPVVKKDVMCCGVLGLVPALRQQRYDAIIATYSLHHLTDEQKVAFITNILDLLQEDGCLYIGDVAFDTRAGLEACRASCGTDWDEDEIYFVYDEMKTRFPQLTFEPMSHCAGLMTLRRSSI